MMATLIRKINGNGMVLFVMRNRLYHSNRKISVVTPVTVSSKQYEPERMSKQLIGCRDYTNHGKEGFGDVFHFTVTKNMFVMTVTTMI